MAKAKPQKDPKGRGPSQKGLEQAQRGNMDPLAELQAIIAAKQGMDPMLGGPPARMATMQNQLQSMQGPAVRPGEQSAMMQPDAVQAILSMILGSGAGGPPGGAPPGPPELRDVDQDGQ